MVNIAIDGPAGAGKSSIARRVSAEMGYIYVDTGALYRAVALYMEENYIEGKENITSALGKFEVSLGYENGRQRVFLNNRDVSEDIRKPEISMKASAVSAIPSVRDFLFDLQRNIALNNNIIMDGRDIGTVVLPDAQVKIFLTASAEERAKRRFAELSEKPDCPTFDEVLHDIVKRDYNDMNRPVAPLKQADDAVLIDTTEMNIEEAVLAVKRAVEEGVNAI